MARPALSYFSGLRVCVSRLGGGRGGKNVIRAGVSTGIYSLSPLRTTCCARMWGKTRCHTHPCLVDHPENTSFASLHGCGTRRVVTSWPLQEVYGLTKFRLESARKRCRRLGSSTVNIQKCRMLQSFLPFCLVRFVIDSAFSQGFGNVQQQALCTKSKAHDRRRYPGFRALYL